MKLRLFIDGASRGNPGPAAIGVVVEDHEGKSLMEISERLGETTNNVAEYTALLRGVEAARRLGGDDLEIYADSDLLVRQIRGEFRVKSPLLAPLHRAAREQLGLVGRWRLTHIPRGRNSAADLLANRALDEGGSRPERVTPDSLPGALEDVARRLNGVAGIGVRSTWDGLEIYHNPDRPFPTASVFKIPVLLELLLQAEEGRLRLDERVVVSEELKSPGSGVLKELSSSPALSISDLAMLMIIISDNSATDILVERLGRESINARLQSWGLEVTRVPLTCRQMLFDLAGRPEGPFTDAARIEVERALRLRERKFAGRAYADTGNNVTTPREMVALLDTLVTPGRLSANVREQALAYLRRQQIRDRLPLHLPPEAEIAHKTGSIMGVRNDAGVLFMPKGPVLLCVFTRDLVEDAAGTAAVAEVGRLVYEAFAEPGQS